MNKKFSTLVAALLLSTTVGTFTAQAQLITPGVNTTKAYATAGDKGYENGKAYLLQTADGNYVGVEWNLTSQVWELKKLASTASTSLPDLYKMMWTVQVVENAGAEPIYTFINKYTQTILSVDLAAAKANASIVDVAGTFVAGKTNKDLSYTMDGNITLFHSAASYKQPTDNRSVYANVGNDEVVYLTAEGADDSKIYARKVSKSEFETSIKNAQGLRITPYKMGPVTLSANDLNTMLYAGLPADEAKSTDYFDLTFNPNLASVFNETQLQAVAVKQEEVKYGSTTDKVQTAYASLYEKDDAYKNGDRDYVALKNVKGEYLVVDTSYVAGTDNNANGLLKITTDGLYNAKNNTRLRQPGSYLFKFTLNVTDQNVDIAVKEYVRKSLLPYKATGAENPTNVEADLEKFYGKDDASQSFSKKFVKAGSQWFNNDAVNPDGTLATWNKGGLWADGNANTYNSATGAVKVQDTRYVTHVLLGETDYVTIGAKHGDLSASTESNVIDIKIGAQNVYIPTTMANGAYLLQDVETGRFLADNLVGNWELIEQAARQDFQHMPAAQWIVTSNGNATTVVNREFENTYMSGILYKGDASNEGFFYGGTKFKFIPVADATDKYLGYKWIKDEELNETRFTFNYLHDLAMDKPLNTINTKDSVVWVDKDGEAMSFSLVQVVDDEYGYNGGLSNVAKLNRRVYKIKVNDANKLKDNKRYLAYDSDLKKYVVSTTSASMFFLKENNDVDGEHYYTLLRANTAMVGKLNTTRVASIATVNGNEYYYAGTISDEAERVTDNDYTSYYYVYPTKVVNESGVLVDGYVPSVSWIDDPSVAGVTYLTQDQGKASEIDGWDNVVWDGSKYKITWSDGSVSYAIYAQLGTENRNYASFKVSVDNNTLALVNGVLSDYAYSEVANSAFAVKYAESQLYRHEAGMENVKVFRVNSTAKEYLYEDALSKYSAGKEFNFLGVEGKGDAKNAAMFLDTAYVNRETIMPQYMFVLRPEFTEADTIWCNATEGHKHATLTDSLACEHTSVVANSVKGWYLVNLTDSVAAENDRIAKAEGGILSNKYLLDKTNYTRLGFVKATHIGDSLIIDNSIYTGDTRQITPGYATTYASKDTINLAKNEHNKVAFSFRLVDDSDDFLIESQGDKKAPTSNGGWIKIQNGVPVIAQLASYHEAVTEAELFNLEATDEDPTANEEVAASEVSVVAVQGAIIVKGAAGKVVTVANILGQTIANQVAASDNVTIAAPAGVAVVTVDGEATKVVVK